jgi:hypothetical protein
MRAIPHPLSLTLDRRRTSAQVRRTSTIRLGHDAEAARCQHTLAPRSPASPSWLMVPLPGRGRHGGRG